MTSEWRLNDKYAIAGVGTAGYWRASEKGQLALACEVVKHVAMDAGIKVNEIDALITYQYNNDISRPQEVAQALGITGLNLCLENWLGATMQAGFLGIATALCEAGLAKNVVIYRAARSRSGPVRVGGTGSSAATSDIEQFLVPQGWANMYTYVAASTVRFMHEYGLTEEQLGAVAVNAFRNAHRSERAVNHRWGPESITEYLDSPYMAYPIRRWDFTSEADGGCAYLITSAERARDLAQKPVYITSLAQAATPNARHYGRYSHFDLVGDDPLTGSGAYFADELFGRAGLERSDVDVLCAYDHSTYAVISQLGDLGFCDKADAGAFAASGAIGLDGTLPVNPRGGLIGEGYIHGSNLIVDAVEQLRGTAGPCQVEGARVAMVTNTPSDPLGGGAIFTTR